MSRPPRAAGRQIVGPSEERPHREADPVAGLVDTSRHAEPHVVDDLVGRESGVCEPRHHHLTDLDQRRQRNHGVIAAAHKNFLNVVRCIAIAGLGLHQHIKLFTLPLVTGDLASAHHGFDGAGNGVLFNVEAADYNYFEGITFRNSDVAILAGIQFIAGSKGLTVKNSRLLRWRWSANA